MNSDFNQKQLNQIISSALDDSVVPIDRLYGQLGFMESQVIESIFTAFKDRIGETDLINVIRDSRIPAISVKNNFKITDLHTVTKNCSKCKSSLSVDPQLPKWNVNNPDVVFIMDSPLLTQQVTSLFVAALKKSGFNSNQICLTYLVRCPVISSSIDDVIIGNCSNYLHQEIQIMNPKLVVPIGSNPLKLFFGPDAKIKTYKGKITWLGSWPIFPIYSLLYILKIGASAEEIFYADMLQAYQFCYSKGS